MSRALRHPRAGVEADRVGGASAAPGVAELVVEVVPADQLAEGCDLVLAATVRILRQNAGGRGR